jgi:hypothetical protein
MESAFILPLPPLTTRAQMSVFSTPASSFIPTMPPRRLYQSCLFGLFALMAWVPLAWAGDRLLGTWGVSSVDGPGGGGLVPWATISGTGSDNQIGAAAYATRLATQGEYELRVVGAAVGIRDRLELNMARWSFKLGDVVPGKAIEMSSVGAKLRLVGNAVYDQDRKLPQISLGLQRKSVDDAAVARSLGAQHDHDVELYVTATKVWLGALWGRNVIGTVALRDTRANQFGLLGFGGPTDDSRHWRAEGSLGLMVNDGLVLGSEYRQKPNLLATSAATQALKEDAAWDVFVAWFPSRLFNVTAAWVDLGNIVGKDRQAGWYLSGQFSF